MLQLKRIKLEITFTRNNKEFRIVVNRFSRVEYQDICNFKVAHNCNLFLVPVLNTLENGHETEKSKFIITGKEQDHHYSCIYDNEISNVHFIDRIYNYEND